MNKHFDSSNRILAYLDGSLPEAELRQLTEERAKDSSLDAAIKEFELLHRGIEVAGRAELREKIARWEREAVGRSAANNVPWLWAAGFMLLISIGTALYLGFRTTEPGVQSLAEQFFEPYPSIIGERNGAQPSPLDSLMRYYQARKFLELIEQFKHSPALPDEELDLWDFYLAESFMAEGKYAKAADILSTYTDRNHALFEIARFHHALALLLHGNLTQAYKVLLAIQAEEGPYQLQADILIKKLEQDVFGEE